MTRKFAIYFASFIAFSLPLNPLLPSSALQTINPLTSAFAEEAAKPTINVMGSGTISLAPDMAIVNLGVLREGKTAREALTANNTAMAEIIATMKAEGIEDKDLQTANFLIQPQYVYDQPKVGEEQKPPRIVGYTVSNDLTIRIRNLEKIGEILDASVSLGANSGGNIQFTNDDPKEAIDKARAQAMMDAKSRAETLTKAAGVSLGKLLSINESFSAPSPIPMAKTRMMADAAMAESVPIEGGENSYNITISASWEIAQ
jgi:uncharacterized protein YggE